MNDMSLATEHDHDREVVEDADIIQLVGLKLGEEEYAIDVLKIQEIIRTVEITIVPRSDSFVLGVMNLRGKVIPVIDLRVRFNLEKMDFDKATRIINVRFEKENIGFVVDEVTQVIRISKSMVEPTPPLVGAIGQEYILGICKYDQRLILLLDIDRVVSGQSGDDSNLRKRVLDTKEKHGSGITKKDSTKVSAPKKQPIAAKPAEAAAPTAKYSMADEADAASKPLIQKVDDDDDDDDAINDVLNSAMAQGKAVTVPTDASLVKQGDLDSLIAAELTKREAETDELNKRRREAMEEAENALSIDELIAAELAIREAETEELNKKHREEAGEKKK